MQIISLVSFVLLAILSAVSATPFTAPHPDGVYHVIRSDSGNTFVPFTATGVAIEAHGSIASINGSLRPLAKRDSTACFNAGVSGADKGSAVNTLAGILGAHPQVTAHGGIAVIQGSSIAYVCNNAGSSQAANPSDASVTDNSINNSCGSSTAGRYDFTSGIEFGRTANGKPFCDGS